MGNCAENTAKICNISRQEQDDYAINSYKRSEQAYASGAISEELVQVSVPQKKGTVYIGTWQNMAKLFNRFGGMSRSSLQKCKISFREFCNFSTNNLIIVHQTKLKSWN